MISIIIVHYKVFDELVGCISSIIKSKPTVSYEIIVVDNDEVKTIEKKLKKTLPNILYVRSLENGGYGYGNNLGAKHATGEYLFFLNPDTEVKNNCIDILASFIDSSEKIGVVAPLLLDPKGSVYSIQGAKVLTPLRAIFTLSFLYKLFPQNKIAKEYFLFDWNKKNVQEVDVIPGTGFLIQKDIFNKIGGFDERFFLFFEEHDLCFRVQALGYKIFMLPAAQIVHAGGQSTKHDQAKAEKTFRESRFLYFQKYYGTFWAHVVAIFCR